MRQQQHVLLARPAAAARRAAAGPAARSNGRRASSPAAAPRLRLALGLARQPAQVHHRQRHGRRLRAITCTGSPVRLGEGGAQRLVPAHDLVEAAPAPPRPARRAAAARRACCRRRCPAPAGPGTRAAAARTTAAAASPSRTAGTQRRRRCGCPRPAQQLLHPRGELRQRRRLEERPQRQLHPERLAHPRRPPACASSEWPPSSKKSSCTPTRSTPSTSAQIPASQLLHRRRAAPRTPSLRARRAPAPAAPAGPPCRWASAAAASSTTKADGTMYSGSAPPHVLPQLRVRRRRSRRRDHVGHQPPVARRRPPAPPPPPRAPPGAAAAPPRSPPARCGSRGSSPGGRSGPGTPAPRRAVHRTRSPERYSRAPGSSANGSRHEPLRRQLRPAQVAARQARAADVQLARHAHAATGSAAPSSTYARRSGIGPPITLALPPSTSARDSGR